MRTSSNMVLVKNYLLKGLLLFQVSFSAIVRKPGALSTTLDTVALVREFILNNPDVLKDKTRWIRGGGWDHTVWPSAAWPSAVSTLNFDTPSLSHVTVAGGTRRGSSDSWTARRPAKQGLSCPLGFWRGHEA